MYKGIRERWMFRYPIVNFIIATKVKDSAEFIELLIISALPQPCHHSAHRGSTWLLLSRCNDRHFSVIFQIFLKSLYLPDFVDFNISLLLNFRKHR